MIQESTLTRRLSRELMYHVEIDFDLLVITLNRCIFEKREKLAVGLALLGFGYLNFI